MSPAENTPKEVSRPETASRAIQGFVNDQEETMPRIDGGFIFDFDRDRPCEATIAVARRLAGVIGETGSQKVVIGDHTKSWGTPLYNDDLSIWRAGAVAGPLIAAGVNQSLLEVKGYRESRSPGNLPRAAAKV